MADEAALRLRGSKVAVIIQYASWCVNNDYWLVLCMDYVLNTEKWVENKILDGKTVKVFAHRPSNSWVLRCCFWNLESADESWKMESGVPFTTTDQEPSPGISPDKVPGLVSEWKRLLMFGLVADVERERMLCSCELMERLTWSYWSLKGILDDGALSNKFLKFAMVLNMSMRI